nr:MAG TPA: hypothetical protein [Caudoviricetes sp.]
MNHIGKCGSACGNTTVLPLGNGNGNGIDSISE